MLNQKPLVLGIVYCCPCLQTQNWSFPKAPSHMGCPISFTAPTTRPIVLSIVSQSSCIKRRNTSFSATIQKALSVFSN